MNKTTKRSLLYSGCAVMALCQAMPASARIFNIPSEDANKAIPEFARQAGIQIIAPGDYLRNVYTPAVKGDLEMSVALNALLSGTGAEIASNNGQTVILRIAPSTQAAVAEGGGAQGPTETVTVTGSRVISDIANSPTPLTTVTTEQLQSTTPTTIPDALNKLPVFFGSSSQRSNSAAGSNTSSNSLNLRGFGSNRTLVLLDGHRVAPSNFNGTVDTDVLPQMLVQRVDVVTGGASAVYGSDAVTGVVNFILDKNFVGLKYNANAGISKYSDAASYQAGVAAGSDILGGRGHVEGALRVYHQDAVPITARPYGTGLQGWALVGAGTAANPYVLQQYLRLTNEGRQGGILTCTCSANNSIFLSNGILGPYNYGTPTGTPSLNVGGDGGTNNSGGSFQASLATQEAFGRFSYTVNDTTTAYLQLSAVEANNFVSHAPASISPGPGRGNQFYANNAYLPPATQAQLQSGNPTGTFTFSEFFDTVGGQPGYATHDTFSDASIDRYLSATLGMTGTIFGDYTWDIFYTHGQNGQETYIPHNTNIQKEIAATDAVAGPSGVVCHVSLTASASRYPGCVPINPFGPTSLTQEQFNYFTNKTWYVATNILDNIGGSVAGDVFNLPAGPVKAALSAEARWQSMDVVSPFNPSAVVDCTDLRLCTSQASLYDQPIVGAVNASYDVYEFAGEVNIPILKDLPLIQTFDVDLAGRYTNYSTSGGVETWKIGMDYHVDDSVRFRGTASVDIRAPNLFDLYQPLTVNTGGFNDVLTKINVSILHKTQGNPNLKPEVAHTYTGGVVLTPTFLPGFTASVDYYKIDLSGAITSLAGSSTDLQNICINSGGTSPYCVLVVRPFPYTNTTPANLPTYNLTESINSASLRTEGADIELDYSFDMADLIPGAPGAVMLRNFTSYQPYMSTVNYPNSPVTYSAKPKVRNSGFISYKFGSWGVDLQDTWFSGFSQSTMLSLVYAQPHLHSYNTLDVTVDKELFTESNVLDAYVSIQNIINAQPPVAGSLNPVPGEFYPVIGGENAMGRYFMIGVRGAL